MKEKNKISRREFLKDSALLGSTLIYNKKIFSILERFHRGEITSEKLYELAKPENILYTVCLQCNTGCGIKVKLMDGVAVKIDGNPFSPWTFFPHLKYESSPFDVAKIDGAICPKGQSGIQTAYDPYRITKVLKRAGKRGENKWETISFEQAIDEIVNGGYLFKNVPGEENRYVEGLKDIYVLRDEKLSKEMAEDVKKIWKKKMTVDEFKNKYKENLNVLIDPDHPDLGPKNNQFVYMWGRKKGGRSDLSKRFFASFGSINTHGHTTVCQGSLYFTGKAMSEQYVEGTFKDGEKFYWQADVENSEFIIFVGANLFEANYGPSNRTPRLMNNLILGKTKFAVVDPRFSKLASKAFKWIPIKPGTDAALAMGMIRWIIENGRFDKKYLENANKAAAKKDNEPTWCNASWLVKIEKGKPTTFLRASEIKLKEKELRKTKEGAEYEFEYLVVMKEGKPIAFDPNDEREPVEGDLFVDTEIEGIKVKSSFQILREEAQKKTIEEYAKIADVRVEDIVELAREFTNHGKKSAIDIHRGVSQHTNGFYNVFAFLTLNLLIGNYDWKGGMIKATTFDAIGKKEGMPYNLEKLHKGKLTPFGISIIRHDVKYEETTIFTGYPAKRNFYPLSSDIYQEIIPSIGDAYPYPIKALFLYMGAPLYSLPAGDKCIEILSDTEKVPLFFACDILIGTTSMYADYIFPDLSYLERWEFHGSHPNISAKVMPVRQPVIPPLTEKVKVYGEEMPISYEAILLAIAEKLNLPGFGENAFGEGKHLKRPEDFYLKMVANIAFGEKADGSDSVPDADEKEIQLFISSRKHLPESVFNPEKWEKSVGSELWKKVIYVLNRGGRFQDFDKVYKDEQTTNKYGKLINLYQEKTAKCKNSITGEPFAGYPKYIPIKDIEGKEVVDEGYELNLITHRIILQTKSRTITNYWLSSLLPENFIIINPVDAEKYGVKDGDRVKIISLSNKDGIWNLKNFGKKDIIGRVKVSEGIRPSVISFCLGYGLWATGANDFEINGKIIKGDGRRGKGINANAVMTADPYLKNTPLLDSIGGSVSFYDSKVKIVKI